LVLLPQKIHNISTKIYAQQSKKVKYKNKNYKKQKNDEKNAFKAHFLSSIQIEKESNPEVMRCWWPSCP